MKFNLKGLNLNMLLLVAILVGVLVVILRQNNKCMMDEGVEGFRWRNSFSNFFARMRRQQEQLERRIREAQQRAVNTTTATNNISNTDPTEPCGNCVCETNCGNRHSPFATFRGVQVHGFTPIGSYTDEPLERLLTVCGNRNDCHGVIAYGNNKILMKNIGMNKTYRVSDDNPNITSYIRWNTWMEQDAGYNTMMKLPDGSTRNMNWDTFTTV
jgi:hypothetical protein